jgi:hypothetical protein
MGQRGAAGKEDELEEVFELAEKLDIEVLEHVRAGGRAITAAGGGVRTPWFLPVTR